MKKLLKYSVIAVITGFLAIPANNTVTAGNKDRAGQAGAMELLINPWARSSGWGDANSACIRGLESVNLNVAGTAFIQKTELVFNRTNWLQGSDIHINTFGFSQKAGEASVISLAIMAMSFGEIEIATVDEPDGGIGTYSPTLMNINLSYAKAFSNSIYGGLNCKIISEAISNVSAQGIALDAGIQYVTGTEKRDDNIKFGISLRNVGFPLRYSGDGLSFRGFVGSSDNSMTLYHRSAPMELPTMVNIGGSYDFYINKINSLTAAFNFRSNSFTKDQYMLGLEYSYKSCLFLRAGYAYEDGITKLEDRTTVYTGPCAGFSVDVPMSKDKETKEVKSKFSLDYSYRATNPFDGTHSIGIRISL